MKIIAKRNLYACLLVFFLFFFNTVRVNASGIDTIDSSTFKSDYSISEVHIGSSVSEITSTAFRNLVNLREITVSEKNPFFASYSGCLYDKGMTELVCFPPALKGAIIPDTVISIRENALHGLSEDLKEQVRSVVEEQANWNLPEAEVPGEHFVHTIYGVRWRQNDGNIVLPYSNIMSLAGTIVDASSTGDMTQPKQLEEAFNFFSDAITYERSMDVPSGDWIKEYASKTLSEKKGNCYGYAAAFGYVARGLGYEARVCTGTVESALGGRAAHAWTEIKMNNKWYIFDTEMQNAKGSGYYKQTDATYPAGPIERQAIYTIEF
ncbi:transglutaminase domain-containing protein [Butyrivibrio sp. YAB3001]|uniref:transglutaminase domain-containing protein n=1 Tax=Butyrivibrio sp. YAB3001 TaxID=1520812 RepID=UPI0008F66A88|nr:transglutaminase domain-containing protein [Butyrivibrio sp. YAB3001]SFC41843.1 Leucine rich repeat-containing protein [Butyrivibrio sp. YAB3001]